MIGKISFNDRVKISYDCGSDPQFQGKLEQVVFEKKKGKTLADANEKNSCMLQICYYTEKKTQGNGRTQFDVTYNCQSSVKSLQQILEQELKLEEKMDYFYKLIELAINHKNQKITHFNIKPSNVILYKDRFYLIDFGYLNDKPSKFVISLNYIQNKDNDYEHKRNLFPYLNDQFLRQIKENNNEKLKEKLQKMSQVDIQNYDRYALGVMMLELFVPLKDRYGNFDIDTCIDQAKNRKMQLEKIYDCQEDYGVSIVEQIKKIIQDILLKYELPSDKVVLVLKQQFQEYQNSLQRQQSLNISLNSVNESERVNFIDATSEIILSYKMPIENKAYVINLIDDHILQFDPNLLYYLDNKDDLNDYYNKIQDSQLEKLKTKAKQILHYYKTPYGQKLYQEDFCNLNDEDKYYILNNILKDYDKFEYNIKDQIKQLNQMDPKQFVFNQINKQLTQNKEQIQEIVLTQKKEVSQQQELIEEKGLTDQTENHFEQMLQNKIPNIMHFLKYYCILKKNNQELNDEFESMKDQNSNFYSAKLKNQNEYWTIIEKPEKYKKLFIGKSKFDSSKQYEGRIIEETKYQILDYENVTYNLEQDENFGEDVKISIYNKSMFELISFYKGQLKGNKYNGKGFIKDWKNNYEYDGQWKQGKKDGKNGKLKILNTEVLLQYEFSELEVDYSDDYLKKGKTPQNQDQEKKSFEIKFYFYEALKVYKCDHKCDHNCNDKCYHNQDHKYFIKFDCSKLCKILNSKLVDSVYSIKNSLCDCKKVR